MVLLHGNREVVGRLVLASRRCDIGYSRRELLRASVDTSASTAVLLAFYPAADGRLLYVAIAIVAAVLIVATRGRLGYADRFPTSTG